MITITYKALYLYKASKYHIFKTDSETGNGSRHATYMMFIVNDWLTISYMILERYLIV